MTNRSLDAQRNLLLGAAVLLFAVNTALGTVFHFRLPDWELLGGFGVVLAVAVRLVYVYTVYRVSHFLSQPAWVTLLYVVLAVFAGFELIPLVGLLISIRKTRGMLDETR